MPAAIVRPRPWCRHLYAQVLLAMVPGIVLAHFEQEISVQVKPLGDGVFPVFFDFDDQHAGHTPRASSVITMATI